MKQRLVIRVEAGNTKYHTKAMEIAVRVPGVETVSLQGEKNQLTVIGHGIDAVSLTTQIRKKLGFAQLISLTPYHAMEMWEDFTACRPTVQPIVFPEQSYHAYVPPYYVHDVGMNHHDSCMIL